MPKNNKTIKHDGRLFKQKVSATHRIGTRKGGTSAHKMSNSALLEVLNNNDQSKFHPDASAVLKLRGVSV
jgi:hypothetical protein